jgi:hypothetical protein
MDEDQIPQTIVQKKIAFAQSPEMFEAALAILRESVKQTKLVGDTEHETVVNAVTLDAQSQLIMDFIGACDRIKSGQLHTSQ